jgi:hypothetical protein
MDVKRNEDYRDTQYLHDQCEKNMFYHIVLTMKDGSVIDGVIESVEPDRIIVLVGEDVMEKESNNETNQQRQISGYGRPRRRRRRRRFRRFRRRGIPLASLAALRLLQYPYYAPPYPYYYPYYHNDDDYDYDDYDDYDD